MTTTTVFSKAYNFNSGSFAKSFSATIEIKTNGKVFFFADETWSSIEEIYEYLSARYLKENAPQVIADIKAAQSEDTQAGAQQEVTQQPTAKDEPSANEWVSQIKSANPAIGCYAEDGVIMGSYRGKSSEKFKFDLNKRSFIFNTAPSVVENTFKQIGLLS